MVDLCVLCCQPRRSPARQRGVGISSGDPHRGLPWLRLGFPVAVNSAVVLRFRDKPLGPIVLIDFVWVDMEASGIVAEPRPELETGNPTAGNGTLDVYVYYRIVSV